MAEEIRAKSGVSRSNVTAAKTLQHLSLNLFRQVAKLGATLDVVKENDSTEPIVSTEVDSSTQIEPALELSTACSGLVAELDTRLRVVREQWQGFGPAIWGEVMRLAGGPKRFAPKIVVVVPRDQFCPRLVERRLAVFPGYLHNRNDAIPEWLLITIVATLGLIDDENATRALPSRSSQHRELVATLLVLKLATKLDLFEFRMTPVEETLRLLSWNRDWSELAPLFSVWATNNAETAFQKSLQSNF
ncbi:MAG: hypothetical protein R3C03_09715 [Pirellulaceae bacterium]